MKYFITAILSITGMIAFTQTPDCVEGRYTTDLFPESTITTVQYNLNGQLIRHQNNVIGDQVKLNVSEINSGFYLLELVDKNGGVEVRKVIIQ